MNLDGFPWPIMGERETAPIWEDDHFIIGSERFEIPTYSESESAWSPELAARSDDEIARGRLAVLKQPIWGFSCSRSSRWSSDGIKRRERICPTMKKRISSLDKSGGLLALGSCRWRFGLERAFGPLVRYPFGIRAVLRLQKTF
jgi:hypothetical protein